MLLSSLAMSSGHAHFLVGIDTDDPQIEVYRKWDSLLRGYRRVHFHYQARLGLSEWSNYLAWTTQGTYDLLLSVGDDHAPILTNWDWRIASAHAQIGHPAVLFPVHKSDLGAPPSAFSVPYKIAHALGWFTQPEMRHYWIDNVWADLAHISSGEHYLASPAFIHLHHLDGLADIDSTYRVSEALQLADHEAYQHWLTAHCAADAATIQRLAMPQ